MDKESWNALARDTQERIKKIKSEIIINRLKEMQLCEDNQRVIKTLDDSTNIINLVLEEVGI